MELPPGPTTLVITSDGGSSDPFPITLEAYGPDFFKPNLWGAVFIERALPNGGFAPSSCLVGETPERGGTRQDLCNGTGSYRSCGSHRLSGSSGKMVADLDGSAQILLAPDVSLCGLNEYLSKQELNLFQFGYGSMRQERKSSSGQGVGAP